MYLGIICTHYTVHCATETLGVILLQLVRVGYEEEHCGGQQLKQGGDDADDEVARVQERQHLQR